VSEVVIRARFVIPDSFTHALSGSMTLFGLLVFFSFCFVNNFLVPLKRIDHVPRGCFSPTHVFLSGEKGSPGA